MLKHIDYFGFKIYKTYRRIDKTVPRFFYYGPLHYASATAALYPVMLLFSFSVYLGVWSNIVYITWQFITALVIAFSYFLIGSYFQSRMKKTYFHYSKETGGQRFWGAIAVNTIIVFCIFTFVVVLIYKL